ncbi:hypothetical protein ABEV34_07965 [Methylorubrum rhodesianum]|jgi:hypothetical protein|uniref:hypothetical protein n=1 Tax=Methylorubrum TaxID=2282523 RepID=UPI00129C2D97|nr:MULTISPECIES: hypothetical protein [Methylorubrum]MBB5764932.1 hypothetical protein [Methylorubrum rhodesianum]MBI1690851.1 hypothetical protein [Methylorubrum sp. DB1722]MRI56674.1 hypothetical protein [Methylobacterium sp. DB1607]
MPHFSKEALEASPETLAKLREILHGRQQGGRTGRTAQTTPAKEGRFGPSGGRGAPVRKRRQTATVVA